MLWLNKHGLLLPGWMAARTQILQRIEHAGRSCELCGTCPVCAILLCATVTATAPARRGCKGCSAGLTLGTALLCTSQCFAGSCCAGKEGACGADPTAQGCGQTPHCQCWLWRAPAHHTTAPALHGESQPGRACGSAGGQGLCPGVSSPRAPQSSSQICPSVRSWTKIGDSGRSPAPSSHFKHFVTAKSVCSQIPPLKNNCTLSTLSAENRQNTESRDWHKDTGPVLLHRPLPRAAGTPSKPWSDFTIKKDPSLPGETSCKGSCFLILPVS